MKVVEKEDEQRHWEMYLARFTNMTQKDYKPFSEFYKPNKATPKPKVKQQSKQEILDDAASILHAFQREKGGG